MVTDDLQRLRAGYALAPDRFCVAFHAMQADDPFSIVLLFDGRLHQPWGRVDIRRNVVDLARSPHPDGRGWVGVTDEGDVYEFDDALVAPVATRISGAGVHSEDADGSGPISGLATLAGELHAFGASGQIYQQSNGGTWQRLSLDAAAIPQRSRIARVAQADDGSMLVIGTIEPGFWELSEEMERAQLEAAMAGDIDRFEALSRQAEERAAESGPNGVATGFAALKGDVDWSRVETDTPAELRDVLWDGTRFWVVGASGTVLSVDRRGEVENRTAEADRRLDLFGITLFDGRIVIISDFALHEWSESGLIPFEPALPAEASEPPQPVRVRGVADTLFVLDAKRGVHRLSGTQWEHIAIPSELLKRPFEGLRQRSP